MFALDTTLLRSAACSVKRLPEADYFPSHQPNVDGIITISTNTTRLFRIFDADDILRPRLLSIAALPSAPSNLADV